MENLSNKVAGLFSVLGDITRLRILGMVSRKALTVNEIRDHLGDISLQALSYQLKQLKKHHLIKIRRDDQDGRRKLIYLADKHIAHILNDAIVHIQGGKECEGVLDCEDTEKLKLLAVIQ